MSKYLYLYRGPATPPEQMGEEQTAEVMAAWNKWIEQTGSALVDVGTPLLPRTAVVDDGTTAQPSEQNGYSIVEADDLDGAKALATGHPFLAEGKGRFSIEIFEVLPLPM